MRAYLYNTLLLGKYKYITYIYNNTCIEKLVSIGLLYRVIYFCFRYVQT